MFINEEHMKRFYEEVGSPVKARSYGIAMFILTGMPSLYPRVTPYVDKEAHWIDFREMTARVQMSNGERHLVDLAWNIYNGGIAVEIFDIMNGCSPTLIKLAMYAINIYLGNGVM